ncbi:LysR family transcriptional regulator [Nocardia sp. NPDC019395]|uniref:LysR family transcriptional regulator n=1 Tax=Nocardia sp. NPDC019395 TaxID=3154686 RepID=UPI0033F631D4
MATLDIPQLRSVVAVATFSSVRRAAEALHLTPSAVSNHLRKLEKTLGTRLVTAQGRGIGLTSDGEELVARARVILTHHDDAIHALAPPGDSEFLVAATEHAAQFLVPSVVSTLNALHPGHEIRLRLTRSAHVRDLVHDDRADVALMLTRPARGSHAIAELPLQWFGTDDAPRDRLIFFTRPCAVRDQALASLTKAPHRVVKECPDLTGVLTAARHGLGVTPLPRLGPPPDGISRIDALPPIPDVTLYAATSDRIDAMTRARIIETLRARLTAGRRVDS